MTSSPYSSTSPLSPGVKTEVSPDPFAANSPLVSVRDLSVTFPHSGVLTPVVEGVDLSVEAGRTLALVGESGCGKSVTGLSLMGLTPFPGRVVAGSVRLAGEEILNNSPAEWRALRGRKIGMVFQDPLTSLDPVYTAGDQVAEGIRFHYGVSRKEAFRRAVQALEEVGIPRPESAARSYPHQLSGGMRQRALIAAAIACEPDLLIADEPTTALDVTVQLQIIELLEQIQRNRGMAILLITHDLGVVARMAHTVAVMYAGQIVESGDVRTVIERPAHPYTAGLLAAAPRMSGPVAPLQPIPGTVPPPGMAPAGCRFRPRCFQAGPGCELPQLIRPVAPEGAARCLYPLRCDTEAPGEGGSGDGAPPK